MPTPGAFTTRQPKRQATACLNWNHEASKNTSNDIQSTKNKCPLAHSIRCVTRVRKPRGILCRLQGHANPGADRQRRGPLARLLTVTAPPLYHPSPGVPCRPLVPPNPSTRGRPTRGHPGPPAPGGRHGAAMWVDAGPNSCKCLRRGQSRRTLTRGDCYDRRPFPQSHERTLRIAYSPGLLPQGSMSAVCRLSASNANISASSSSSSSGAQI